MISYVLPPITEWTSWRSREGNRQTNCHPLQRV